MCNTRRYKDIWWACNAGIIGPTDISTRTMIVKIYMSMLMDGTGIVIQWRSAGNQDLNDGFKSAPTVCQKNILNHQNGRNYETCFRYQWDKPLALCKSPQDPCAFGRPRVAWDALCWGSFLEHDRAVFNLPSDKHSHHHGKSPVMGKLTISLALLMVNC